MTDAVFDGWWRSLLARRLLVAIVLFSSAITLALTGWQLYRDYRSDLNKIDSDLREIESVHLQVLTASLWATNSRELATQLNGLSRLPNMQYLAVHEGERLWASAGVNTADNVMVRQFPMVYTHRDELQTIGTLTVVVSLEGVYRRLLDEALAILASNAVRTFLVAGFILLIFHWLIARHVGRIADYIDRLDFRRAGDELRLHRAPQATPDELDRVVSAINRLRQNLRTSTDELRHSEARYRQMVEGVRDYALFALDPAGRIVNWNDGARRLLGYTAEEIVGQSFERFLPAGEAQDDPGAALRAAAGLGRYESEGWRVRRDGEQRWVVEVISVLRDSLGDVAGYSYLVHDITDRKRAEERLHHLAHHDSLTGLPNRGLFNDRLQQAMYEADRHERLVGVAFLDLDQFKLVNDTLGHDAGDVLLKSVTERLQAVVRVGDTVARLSGDEFAFVLADMAHVDDAARVAQKILDVFARPFRVSGRDLFATASLGMTIYPFDEPSVEGLLKNADIAMYRAKERGKNTYQFYAAEMTVKAHERAQLESQLRLALARAEFSVHFQPQVNLHTGRIVGAEALLRWQSPELGAVAPAQFIPVAEETGLIVPVGEWVLKEACRLSRPWVSETGLRVAVNISARQFQDRGFVGSVHRILRDTDFDPRHLELEITESLLLHQTEEMISALRALGDLGVRLTIDDFGTGYSSLAYLRQFPIDILKIDRSFVRDIPEDPDAGAIASGIIALAHSLGIHVIAEGVENGGQAAFFRAQACDVVQGFYFSRPVPTGEFEALLRGKTLLRTH